MNIELARQNQVSKHFSSSFLQCDLQLRICLKILSKKLSHFPLKFAVNIVSFHLTHKLVFLALSFHLTHKLIFLALSFHLTHKLSFLAPKRVPSPLQFCGRCLSFTCGHRQAMGLLGRLFG